MPFSASRGLHYAAPPSETGNRRPSTDDADATDENTEPSAATDATPVPADD
jgi:hypothetical protein